MECITSRCICRPIIFNKIQYLLMLICYRIVEVTPNFQSSIHRVRGMSTCHIQQQSILSVIFILPSFLVIIHHIIVNTIEFPNYSLFLSSILTTCDCCLKPPQHLKTITLIVLHSSRRWLIIINIENLLEIIWGS
uniref:AC5 protein n=1 Tax=Croton yellow vein mosaic virus TaxID=207697 RepID=A0A292PI63_9GEMI|nr:AC5 protein [Croton yellow vein mosaic virus]